MQNDFFSNPETLSAINEYINKLNNKTFQSEFETERNNRLIFMLKGFSNSPEEWDANTLINREYISRKLLSYLIDGNMEKEAVDITFCMCFRFLLEFYISESHEFGPEYTKAKDFALYRVDEFSETAKLQIKYATAEMPISIVKRLITGSEIKSVKEFSKKIAETERLKERWDTELEEKRNAVDALKASLDTHTIAFNFVGLYAGFSKLGKMKSQEYKFVKWVMIILGFALPISIGIEAAIYWYFDMQITKALDLFKLVPFLSITALLLYYFRITLSNYNSIRAQIIQIELRKSLCRFIQSYAEYAKGVKDKDNALLEKFEDIVFSNIMITGDKMPSTFDGLEQIASLINSLKDKS